MKTTPSTERSGRAPIFIRSDKPTSPTAPHSSLRSGQALRKERRVRAGVLGLVLLLAPGALRAHQAQPCCDPPPGAPTATAQPAPAAQIDVLGRLQEQLQEI